MLGGPLDLRVEDDRNEAAEAASVVSKLITRDHVVALIGENASSRSLAAAPIAQSYRIPMISPSSTNVEVTKKGDYIFRVCFTDESQGRALAAFARKNLKAATAAILIDARSDYSVGLADAFAPTSRRAAAASSPSPKYTEGDTDFSAQLTAILPLKPDVLFLPGYYTDAGLIARQARGLGLTATLLGADGCDSPKLTEIGGDAIEGAYFSNHYSVDDPARPCGPSSRPIEAVRGRSRLDRRHLVRRHAAPGRRHRPRRLDGGAPDPRRAGRDERLSGSDGHDHDGRRPQSDQARGGAPRRGRPLPLRRLDRAGVVRR